MVNRSLWSLLRHYLVVATVLVSMVGATLGGASAGASPTPAATAGAVTPSPAGAGVPTITEVSLAPGYVVAGASVAATLQLQASGPLTMEGVGIAVRDSAQNQYDFPAAAANVSLGTGPHTFTSGPRTFAAGTYSVFGFWQDLSGVYHNLPSTPLIVGTGSALQRRGERRRRRAPAPAVNGVDLGAGYAAAGASVTASLQLEASSRLTAKAVGVAVRDSAQNQYDYPAAAANVHLGTGLYTYTSGSRTFAAGTYSVFGFWEDSSGVYHNLPSTTLTVGVAVPPPSGPLPNGIPGPWILKQADEFNGPSLNTSLWQAGWFGSGLTAPINAKEQDCYDSANVTFPGDGTAHLNITSTPSTCGGVGHPYSGALMSTNPNDGRGSGGYQYTYGALEAHVYTPPSGSQIANWPAVWADGQNWPTDGEDDVMEGLHGAACFTSHAPSENLGSCVAGNDSGWHTFASDWEPGSITYYYDGTEVGNVTSGVTNAPMYLILDNTVSASIGGPDVSPASMKVDYIRVWQHT